MATLDTTFHAQASQWCDLTIKNVLRLRLGEREINISRDFRNRFYRTNPFIECRAGVNAGHVEILFLRSWLVVFSKAQC